MKLRERIFNWFANGHISVSTKDIARERLETMAIAKASTSGGYTIGQLGINQIGSDTAQSQNTINVKITPANGGTIVNISGQYDQHLGELYVIPDGADFDSELGKIITHSRLKRT
jgi:hypothetical protein